jgi:iron(III) transport system ATP-binding protein
MTSLEVTDLSVTIGSTPILKNLSITLGAGSFTAILGPSGCGKTTLLRAIAGLIPPSSGTIRFGKQLVSVSSLVLPPHKRKIGYVPQEGGLFPHLSVGENIGFALDKSDLTKDQRRLIVAEMLELIGLTKFIHRSPHELSGGQQTRVALARALAIEPKIVLLDEPFSALDAQLRNDLREEVSLLLKRRNTTAVMVTHDREEALVSADIVALMRDGNIVQYGSPAEVYLQPLTADVAISTGDALLLPATRGKNGILHPLHANFSKARFSQEKLEQGSIVIRPEEIKISMKKEANAIASLITRLDYYGHDAMVELNLEKSDFLGAIRARIPGPVTCNVGDRVFISHIGPIRFFAQ